VLARALPVAHGPAAEGRHRDELFRFEQLDEVDVGVLEELIRKGSKTLPPGAIDGSRP
jgi:hypothetical protein